MTSDVDDLVMKVYTFWDVLLILLPLAISGANAIGSDGAKSVRQYPTDSDSSVLAGVAGREAPLVEGRMQTLFWLKGPEVGSSPSGSNPRRSNSGRRSKLLLGRLFRAAQHLPA